MPSVTPVSPAGFSPSQELNRTFSQISSGQRVNSAADDAAGIAIISRSEAQISGVQQARRNTLDARSLVETEDAALAQINESVNRLQEISVQQGNGILNESDREALASEARQIQDQINQTIENASFNGRDLFQEDSNATNLNFQVGDEAGDIVSLEANTTAEPIRQGLESLDFSSEESADNLEILSGIQQTVTERRTDLGAFSNRLENAGEQLAVEQQNAQEAQSRIQDADFAELVGNLITERIRQEAQLAVQSQGNVSAENTLRLLS